MVSFTQLIDKWDIQLLVLLSFTLQIFLFFTGILRRYSSSVFLRIPIWLAYQGVDLVAVFALGYLLRYEDALGRTHVLAFFWAPFLLIHLGGQDTITAFAIEDNNLWLRHSFTLIMQVILASYVFWKWIGRHNNMHLLAPGIFLFISGIIKYGERTLALMYGSQNNMRYSISEVRENELVQIDRGGYPSIVRIALLSALYVRNIFAGNTFIQLIAMAKFRDLNSEGLDYDQLQLPKLLGVQLGIMYDDLYTKAMVLRTRSGLILRCISQLSAIIALVLFFLVSDKQRYNRADILITYVLFVGGLFLDICAMFILMRSPWTWAWLKERRCACLAGISWFLFSNDIGWIKSKLWSNSMGQYNLSCRPEGSDQSNRSCKQRSWITIGKILNLFGIKKGNLFCINNLLDTKYVKVDEDVMDSVLLGIFRLCQELTLQGPDLVPLPKLGEFSGHLQMIISLGFADAIVELHRLTEFHLRRYPTQEMEAASETVAVQYMLAMVDFCWKLSRYMMYLLATHPEMLPVTGSVDAVIQSAQTKDLQDYELQPCHDTLEGIRDMWILFLAYAAGKSRPEVHAAHLGKGGELITFVWLFMAYLGIGDSGLRRIELANSESFWVASAKAFSGSVARAASSCFGACWSGVRSSHE